jgi:hypothetical protein
MSTSESPRPALTEDDVDGLLTRFFEAEVPAELRSPRRALSPASPRERGGSRSAFVMLSAGLCCVLVVVLLFEREGPRQPGFATDTMLPASPDEVAAPRGSWTDSAIEPGVEERSHLVPASATEGDPPPKIDVMIPELEVELFPPPPPGTK